MRKPIPILRWIEASSQTFMDNISDTIGNLYQIGITNCNYHNDIQGAINLLYNFIINSSHNMLKYNNITLTPKRAKHWYDTDCFNAKSTLNKAFKDYKKKLQLNKQKLVY